MKRFFYTLRNALAIIALAGSLGACTMIEDKLDDCPTGLYVRFVYDYNTVRADLFKDHVGSVRLYVFDENGRLAAQRTVSNTAIEAPLSVYGYTMHFSPAELPAGHSYRLQAVAMQRDWDEALATDGAKYRFTGDPEEHSESLEITLDHTPVAGDELNTVSDVAPLDTLWHTLKVVPHLPQDGITAPGIDKTVKPYSIYPIEDQMVKVENNHATYATVSLIRDTNHLALAIHQVDEPENIFADHYDVKIIDKNATVTHDNTVLTDKTLQYTPYASWTACLRKDGTVEVETVHKGNLGDYSSETRAGDNDNEVVERSAHYNMMFNRLMLNSEDNDDNAVLQIVNKDDGKVVAHVNLPHYLSIGREAYAIYNYTHQEYLDREYDYHLDFFLNGDKWIAVEISVLSWAKRVQNVEL